VTASQAGYSLVWVVAAITIIASLTAGVLSVSTTSKKNEMMLTFDTQARMLAESGINYASGYAGEVNVGYHSGRTMEQDLDGMVITTDLGTNQKITLDVKQNSPNIYDYTVKSTGTVNVGTPYEANYQVTNVINSPVDSGIYIVQSKPGTADASPTSVSVNASALTNYTAGISFDPRFAGAPNNSVTSANFNNGIGSLLNGIRVYFTYAITSGSAADGFVFAIKNGTWNTPHDAGGPLASVSHGSFLGYSGPGYPYWGNGKGIRPPKIGIEFDIYTNSGHTGVGDDGRNDPDNHHIANIFWGTTWSITNVATTAPTNTYTTSSSYAYDDNVHNLGGANDKTDYKPFNPPPSPTSRWSDPGGSGLPGMLSITRTLMVGTASPVPVRVELIRPTAVASTVSTDAHYNMYAYVVKTWHGCTGSGCDDITVDYTGTNPTLQYTVYMTAAEHTMFQFFVYGYQVSTGASTGQYHFSIPKIGMR
jgi:hypothetical protein